MGNRLRSTAYHEAGHAVAACLNRIRFRLVTIEPKGTSLGHVQVERLRSSFDPETEITRRDEDLIERHAVFSYAGAAGAALLRFRRANRGIAYLTRSTRRRSRDRDFDWTGAEKDRRDALNLVSYLICESDELGACLGMLQYRARNVLRANIKLLEALAEQLLKRRTIGCMDVREILRNAAGPYPPGPVWRALCGNRRNRGRTEV